MDSIDKLFEDLEEYRTPREMVEYFDKIKTIVHTNDDLYRKSLIKKGKFKKFLEEFYPLLCFSQSRYCDSDSKLKIVLGNQGYDAVVENSAGMEGKLEITSYIDGKADFNDGKKINERGYSEVHFRDNLRLDIRVANYLELIIRNAIKKSKKSYKDISLLFVVDTRSYFNIFNLDDSEFVISLKQEIGSIKFDAQCVYLMIFNQDKVNNIDNNIYRLDCELTD